MHAVRQASESGIDQRLRVSQVEHVRRYFQMIFVRILDDGLGEVERDLDILTKMVVNPDFDDINFFPGKLAYVFLNVRHTGNFIRNTLHTGRGSGIAADAGEAAERGINASHLGAITEPLLGAHFRADFPAADPKQMQRSYFTLDQARAVAERASAKAA